MLQLHVHTRPITVCIYMIHRKNQKPPQTQRLVLVKMSGGDQLGTYYCGDPCNEGSNPEMVPDEFGIAYGPYVMERYTTGDAQHPTLYFVMSTWNPYTTTIMTVELQRE